MAVVIKSGTPTTASGLSEFRRDPILSGDQGGVKFMFDLSFPWCHPGDDPSDSDVIRDISGTGNGDFDLIAGQSVTFAGGGFDFALLSDEPSVVRGPAGCLASIDAGNQYFMVVGWEKMPISGDWNTAAGIAPSFCTTAGASGYVTPEADMLTVAQTNTPQFAARRQTDGASTVVALNQTALTNYYGQVCQWAFWRNADGIGFRLKSALGTTLLTGAVGSANSGDFSSKQPQWGVPGSFNNLGSLAEHRNAANKRLYRGWVENLEESERSPLVVLDADWTFAAGLARYS
jgi:hypothetical protein